MPETMLIDTVDQIEPLLETSHQRLVVIFKHSLTCGISSGAHRHWESFLASRPADDPVLYALIEIQNARQVSSQIGTRLGVRHESPQAIVVRDGEAVWNASHWSITEESLGQALAPYAG